MKKLAIAFLLFAVAGGPAFSKKLQDVPQVPQVVDATGAVVGTLLQESFVLIDVNGAKIGVTAGRDGFLNQQTLYWFTSDDCSGPRYLGVGSLPDRGVTTTTTQQTSATATLIYPTPPVVVRHMASSIAPFDFDQCRPANIDVPSALPSTLPLSFVAPFTMR